MSGKEKFFAGLLERKSLIIMLVVMVFVAGIFSYIKMPKQKFPKVVLPVATVTVVYPGATAEDMEQLVSEKVEHTCMELDGFDKCESTVGDNYSVTSINLSMDLTQNEVDDRWDELRNKMDTLKSDLPSGVTSITVDDDVMDTAGLILAVTGDNISNDELSQRSKEIADKLRLVKGVKKVSVHGDVPSEVKITVNIDKLNDTNVSLAELAKIIGYHNSTLPTGSIKVDGNNIKVNTSGQFESLNDIKNIVIAANDDYIITKLSDVADVRMEVPDDEGYYIYDNKRSTVLAVYFESGLNVVSLGDKVNKVIDNYNESLPEGINVNKIFMQPDKVSDSINDFVVNLIESIILVVIVVMIGMNFRNAIVVSIAIPLSILMNFLFNHIMGLEIHFVSLASLIVVLGMLVDNSVVVSDAIQKNMDVGMSNREATIKGVASVALPVFVSMLSSVIAFCSIFVLPGAYRQLSISFPIVIITSLICSFLVSMFVTPLTSCILLRKSKESNGGKIPTSRKLYNWAFSHAFKHKALTIIGSIILMLLCASTVFTIDMQIVPTANDDIITIDVSANDENSVERTREIVDNIEQILDEQPETEYYLSGIGLSIPRYDYAILPKADTDNTGDIYVKINLKDGKRFKKTSDMVDFLQNEMNSRVGGATVMVDEIGIFTLNTKPVEVKLYSDNVDDLNKASELVNDMLTQLDGTKGIQNKNELATYNYYVKMDNMKLNTLGLTQAEAQNELSIAMQGRDVSTYRSGNKEYSVVLDTNIDSRDQIKAFKVKSSTMDAKYNVAQFADVSLKPEITSISRIDGRRGRAVGCYTSQRVSEISVQNELEKIISENIDQFPNSVTIENSGKKKPFMEDVLFNIGIAAAVAVIAMLILLLIQFGSFKKVGIVFISVPFGIATGMLGLKITGQPISLFALIGGVSLIGCVMANAIVLIDCITNELNSGLGIEEACKSAGGQRLRPILMSTMTTVLGLLPLALFGDLLFIPMAVLMLVGLFFAMLVNLVLVPLVYYIAFRKKQA